jgi:hypothetical protein
MDNMISFMFFDAYVRRKSGADGATQEPRPRFLDQIWIMTGDWPAKIGLGSAGRGIFRGSIRFFAKRCSARQTGFGRYLRPSRYSVCRRRATSAHHGAHNMRERRKPRTIPNPASRRATARQLDRLIARTEKTLEAMRRGATLRHCQKGWLLDGRRVSPETVLMVTKNIHVVGSGDGLFPRFHQTYSWRA